MARIDPIQTNFTSGELSQKLMGRVDIAKYANGVDTLENFLIMLQGGITRRPGTRFIAETKDSSKASRLIPFQYSADQDYVMEVGDLYIRLFSNSASLLTLSQFTSQYPTAHTAAYVKATSTYAGDQYLPHFATDPAKSLVGAGAQNSWISANGSTANQRFHIDLGSAKVVTRLYYENFHDTALYPDTGAKNFTVWGSNEATAFAELTYGTDTDWTQLTTDISQFIQHPGANVADPRYVVVTNSTAYRYYAIKIADNWGGVGWVGLRRIELQTTLSSTEITSPYIEADIFQINQAHKGDLKYLTHGDYAPRKLSRTSATAFSLDLVNFVRGPFLDANDTATTITPSAATGAGITLTASVAIFDETHVGSLWRVNNAVVKIVTVAAGGLKTVATADVQAEPGGAAGNIGGTSAYTAWAEGAFSGYRGYPAICAFHDGRLYYACTEHEPQKAWGSVLYDYDNFDVDDASDDDAVTFEIATEERVAIRWLSSGNKALSIGSTGGTFSAYGTSNGPITPTDIQVNRDTNYGSALLPAKKISSFLYYVQRNLHKVRELSYYYDYDVTRASDMTMLADLILRDGNGVVDWDYQQSPNDRLWCVRSDGQLAVITRNPEQDVMGWSRIIAGADAVGNGAFESVCVIPKAEDDDQVWVVVKRVINGTTKRFIEFFMAEDFDETWDAVCLDSSLSLDSPKIITGATSANPVVITSVGHGFSNGDQVKINGVVGMTELNDGIYLVADKTDDTFELTSLTSVDINGSAYGSYVSGGEVRKMVNNVTGLTHLEGETVQVQVDGDVPATNSFVVTGGTLVPDLTDKAAVIHVGLPNTPLMKTLRPEGGSQLGTSQGKIKRIPNITARFYRTRACQLGIATKQDRFTFDELYTGDKNIPVPMGWDGDSQLVVTSDKPLPLTLIALMPRISVSDL